MEHNSTDADQIQKQLNPSTPDTATFLVGQDPLSPGFLFVAPGVWPAEKEKEGGRDGTALPARPMAESRIQWVDRSINMSICFLSSNPVMTLARHDEQLALQLPHSPSLTPTLFLRNILTNEGRKRGYFQKQSRYGTPFAARIGNTSKRERF